MLIEFLLAVTILISFSTQVSFFDASEQIVTETNDQLKLTTDIEPYIENNTCYKQTIRNF
jgi:hypothetical protein